MMRAEWGKITDLYEKLEHDSLVLNVINLQIQETLNETNTGEDYGYLLSPLRVQIDYLYSHVRELNKQIEDLKPILREVTV